MRIQGFIKSCYTTRWRDSVNVDSEISNALSMQSGATYSNVKVVSMESLDDEFADKMESSLSVRYGLDQKISKIKQVTLQLILYLMDRHQALEQSQDTVTKQEESGSSLQIQELLLI